MCWRITTFALDVIVIQKLRVVAHVSEFSCGVPKEAPETHIFIDRVVKNI
jgi:hypothetical protein